MRHVQSKGSTIKCKYMFTVVPKILPHKRLIQFQGFVPKHTCQHISLMTPFVDVHLLVSHTMCGKNYHHLWLVSFTNRTHQLIFAFKMTSLTRNSCQHTCEKVLNDSCFSEFRIKALQWTASAYSYSLFWENAFNLVSQLSGATQSESLKWQTDSEAIVLLPDRGKETAEHLEQYCSRMAKIQQREIKMLQTHCIRELDTVAELSYCMRPPIYIQSPENSNNL